MMDEISSFFGILVRPLTGYWMLVLGALQGLGISHCMLAISRTWSLKHPKKRVILIILIFNLLILGVSLAAVILPDVAQQPATFLRLIVLAAYVSIIGLAPYALRNLEKCK